MQYFFKSTGSAHVRLSETACRIFSNTQNGDKVIEAIMNHKEDFSNGKSVVVEIPGEENKQLSVERVTEESK